MNIRIDAKNLCLIAYYDPKSAPGKFEFTFNASPWYKASKLEQAKIALRTIRLSDRDREDLLAYWVNTKRVNAGDLELLKRNAVEVSAEEKAEEDDAMAELLGADYGYDKGTEADAVKTPVEAPEELPAIDVAPKAEKAQEGLLKPAKRGRPKRAKKEEL